MFKYLASLSLIVVLFAQPADAKIKRPGSGASSNAFSCERKTMSSAATAILIDATDGLTPGQVAFVSDNFVKTLTWENENDAISIIALHDEPLQLMTKKTFCAPKPNTKIDMITDPVAQIKARNRAFRRSLQQGFKEVVSRYKTKGSAKSTLLIEATTEIYRNARYSFKHAQKRSLVIVSDLYQSSEILSFFKICKSKKLFASRPLTCPTFKQSVKDNSRFRNYVQKAAPKLTKSDSVSIYYLNVNGRVDRSAERWWTQYFAEAGLPAKQLDIIPELQR